MKLVILMLCFTAVIPENTVTVEKKPLDKEAMQSSAYMNKYCSIEDYKMPGEPYHSQFAPDLHQCLSRCNRDPVCSSVDFSPDKTCNQHHAAGVLGFESGWTHYHRRVKGQDCPSGTTERENVPSPYGNTFCLYADKKCPGHDLYRNAQNIADTTLCMTRCVKLKSCASADFKDGKCNPKDYACTPEELVHESGGTYMERLEDGVDECVCASSYTKDAEGICQPEIVDGTWGDWSVVQSCSATCGPGSEVEERTCNEPQHGGNRCLDSGGNEASTETQTLPCNLGACPVDGTWGDWSVVQSCSATCGPGTEVESRTCTEPQHGGNRCLDSGGNEASTETQTLPCNLGSCPVDGTWGDWSVVQSCSATCGPGTEVEERTCNEPQHGGNRCVDSDGNEASTETQTLPCNLGACPVDGTWGDWSVVQSCSATCGPGTEVESRTCNEPQHGGNRCLDSGGNEASTETQTLPCNLGSCPVGCKYLGRGHNGNNISPGVSSTAEDCAAACVANVVCEGSTFDADKGKCWQHHTIVYSRFYPACDSCELFLKECISVSTADGCEYRGRGHNGNNISPGVSSTAEDCAAACVANVVCQGSTFDADKGKCWQHHTILSDRFYNACDDCILFLKACDDAARV